MQKTAAPSPTPSISRDLQLEKRAQQSAGGESRLNLSFPDLNCTDAHDTDGGHPNPPISPKRRRLRLSPLCQGFSALSPYLEHMASPATLIHQAPHWWSGETRVLTQPQNGLPGFRGDHQAHTVTILPSPIWHTETNE